ncbi:MAG: hypothetical protein INR65_00645 [Gluconacetobacter diazotrophicus]|nr:hypothetical protein [Gluconacetobacter diazotrophicus]
MPIVCRAAPVLVLMLAAFAAPGARADTPSGTAADRPFVVPQRDVDVVYAVPTPDNGPALSQRMRFAAATRQQRVDPPGSGLYMLTDYAARTMTVVQPAQHLATTIPAPGAPLSPDGRAAGGAWSRGATATIAGLSCTDWQTADASGNPSEVCFTDDGVLLRAAQGGRIMLEARTVSLLPQPAAVFVVPDGFQRRRAPAP